MRKEDLRTTLFLKKEKIITAMLGPCILSMMIEGCAVFVLLLSPLHVFNFCCFFRTLISIFCSFLYTKMHDVYVIRIFYICDYETLPFVNVRFVGYFRQLFSSFTGSTFTPKEVYVKFLDNPWESWFLVAQVIL